MDASIFRQHFMNSHFNQEVQYRKQKQKKNKLSSEFDKLFFNFLVIIRYDIPIHYNKHEETQIKYNISQKLESFSYKKKEEIIQNLCFEDTIHLKTLNCLAKYYKLNLVYHHLNVFFKMLYNTCEDPVYIINNNKDFYYCSSDKLEKLYDSKYEIIDINKPLSSASHYKVKEIQEMAKKLQLEQEDLKKKMDYYNHIKSYLDKVLF